MIRAVSVNRSRRKNVRGDGGLRTHSFSHGLSTESGIDIGIDIGEAVGVCDPAEVDQRWRQRTGKGGMGMGSRCHIRK